MTAEEALTTYRNRDEIEKIYRTLKSQLGLNSFYVQSNESLRGFCGKAENVEELILNINKFIQSKDKLVLGKNSRKYYEENFNKDLFMTKLEKMREKEIE